MFGTVFGGATAYPKAKGIWRDDERGGALVTDEPIVVHCYTTPAKSATRRTLPRSLRSADGWGARRDKGRSAS